MKIVIDISEIDFAYLKNAFESGDPEQVRFAISEAGELLLQDGEPIPKGHGRLIDADVLQKFANEQEEKYGISIIDIDEQPTIIEADKEK